MYMPCNLLRSTSSSNGSILHWKRRQQQRVYFVQIQISASSHHRWRSSHQVHQQLILCTNWLNNSNNLVYSQRKGSYQWRFILQVSNNNKFPRIFLYKMLPRRVTTFKNAQLHELISLDYCEFIFNLSVGFHSVFVPTHPKIIIIDSTLRLELLRESWFHTGNFKINPCVTTPQMIKFQG